MLSSDDVSEADEYSAESSFDLALLNIDDDDECSSGAPSLSELLRNLWLSSLSASPLWITELLIVVSLFSPLESSDASDDPGDCCRRKFLTVANAFCGNISNCVWVVWVDGKRKIFFTNLKKNSEKTLSKSWSFEANPVLFVCLTRVLLLERETFFFKSKELKSKKYFFFR